MQKVGQFIECEIRISNLHVVHERSEESNKMNWLRCVQGGPATNWRNWRINTQNYRKASHHLARIIYGRAVRRQSRATSSCVCSLLCVRLILFNILFLIYDHIRMFSHHIRHSIRSFHQLQHYFHEKCPQSLGKRTPDVYTTAFYFKFTFFWFVCVGINFA